MAWLIHSAKGTTWKDHKYIRKEGKRYIYNAKRGISNAVSNMKSEGEKIARIAEHETRGIRTDISNIPDYIHNYQLDHPDAPRSVEEVIQNGKNKINGYLSEQFGDKDQSVLEKGKKLINKYIDEFKKGYESTSNGGFIANFKKGYEYGYSRAMKKRSK